MSLGDLSRADLDWIIRRGSSYARQERLADKPLAERIVGIYFAETSTRTRTAFTAAAYRLGAHAITFGSKDLQITTGESLHDTGQVLARMLDGLVIRSRGETADMRTLGEGNNLSVINAMSAEEHPTQALSDLTFLDARLGQIDGLRMLYVGERNNTIMALCLALSQYRGIKLFLRTPHGFGLPEAALRAAQASATRVSSTIEERHQMDDLPQAVDVVYTTRWQTTGTSKPNSDWRAAFEPFHVSEELMARYPNALFMHDLPAHRGEEVASGVIDGSQSVVFEQTAFKLYSAMAVLEWAMAVRDGSELISHNPGTATR